MDPHEAFLQAIVANPDDDMPRLVYADWLEERGDPRGEFIRLQWTVAQLPAGPERRELEARARYLLGRHEREWLGPIRAMGIRGEATELFRGGLVESVTISTPDLLKHADELFRLAPIRHLRLFKTGRHVLTLAALPYLAGVSTLDLANAHKFDDNNHLDTAGVQALASSPYLTRLTTLDLRWNRIGDEGVGALASSPYLGRLTNLNLFDTGLVTCAGGNGIGLSLSCIQALLASPHLPNLTDLDISGNSLGTGAVCALAASPALARLTSLDLFGNGVGDGGAAALAASPYVAGLRKLMLGRNGIGDEGCRALAASPHLARLTTLDLWDNNVDTAGEEALRTSPFLSRLTDLVLSWNPCQGLEDYAHEIVERYA
jgi:uncharacterized protein (TIGR02996 family)